MNRVIKFKGKRLDNGEWCCGYYTYCNDTHTIHWTNEDDAPWWADVDPLTIGQFSGLHDRVGNEIFEGDIIEYCSGCDSFGSVWQTVIIEFRTVEGGYVGVNQYRQTKDGREIVQNIVRCLNKCIVVGNIHDKTDEE